MRKLLTAGALLVVLAGAIGWWCTDEPVLKPPEQSPPPAAAPDTPAMAPVPAAVPDPAPDPAPDLAPTDNAAVERTAVAEEPQLEHTLRGRAVDGAGRPLAGVTAVLLGWSADNTRAAEWRKQHREPQRIDTKVTTAADGVFTFCLWPPPPFQFALRLEGRGVATWGRRWLELAPGGATDLGDVRLERGTLLRGRVVGADGAPVGNVELRVDSAARLPRDGLERWTNAVTRADGTFAARWALAAGEYGLGIADHTIERPAAVTLAGEPQQTIDVVLQRAANTEIRGVVVDESGAPIHRATVVAKPDGAAPALTDAVGRFRVHKDGAGRGETVLTASKNGYEEQLHAFGEEVVWGRGDVRIELKRGRDLTVLVVRAADGRPVEGYVLRVVCPHESFPGLHFDEERGTAPHAGGRETVRGLRAGRHDVIVEPSSDALAVGATTVDVAGDGAQVTVRLCAIEPRTLRVELAGGGVAAGATVQLIDPRGSPVGVQTSAAFRRHELVAVGRPVELANVVTGPGGECTLRVPADRPLALVLPGPGHAPLALQNVVFPANGPLVVTVSRGGTLRGRVGPERALAKMQQHGGGVESVSLHRGDGAARERFPVNDACTPDSTGAFELTGIPAGHWNVEVRYSSGGWVLEYSHGVAAGSVDIADGETTEVTLDASSMLPGEIDALVLHNGAPLANATLRVDLLEQRSMSPQPALTTDAAGRVRATLRDGEYHVAWVPPRGTGFAQLPVIEPLVVAAARTTRQTLTIVSGTAKLRLVDASGAPVAGTTVGMVPAGAVAPVEWLAPTGADGRIAAVCPPGTFTACVLSKRLQTGAGLAEFYRSGESARPGAMAKARRSMGTVVVRAAATTEIELTVPADW